MKSRYFLKIFGVIFLAAACAFAKSGVPLGTSANFAVLAGSTITNTGGSFINGSIGVSPGSAITGFPPGILIAGTVHSNDAAAIQAQNDLNTAYTNAAGQIATQNLTGQDLGGKTLGPGVYQFSTSAQLTGTLILNGGGNAGAVFIFQIGTALTTASSSVVQAINGAQAANIFWQIGTSATLGSTSTFIGNILAFSSITANTNVIMAGRLLALNGAVTTDTLFLTYPPATIPGGLGGPPLPPSTPAPASLLLVLTGLVFLIIFRKRLDSRPRLYL